jgi:hypothetical protein
VLPEIETILNICRRELANTQDIGAEVNRIFRGAENSLKLKHEWMIAAALSA